MSAPSRSNVLHFHAVFGKILRNNRLAHPPLGLEPPRGDPLLKMHLIIDWKEEDMIVFTLSTILQNELVVGSW